MVKIELELPEYLIDFLKAGVEAYEKYFTTKDEAFSVFVEMICAEYVVSRLAVLVDKEQLMKLQDEPVALFDFAAQYLRNRTIEFEQGKEYPTWTKDDGEENIDG